jgi:hypothetical protein
VEDGGREGQGGRGAEADGADLAALGVIDDVVPEPLGGAHTDWDAAAGALRSALLRHLAELDALSPDERRRQRWAKFEPWAPGEVREPARGRVRAAMANIVEVSFKGNRREYYASELDAVDLSDYVIVEADRGEDLGRVTAAGAVAERKCSGCSTGCAAPVPVRSACSARARDEEVERAARCAPTSRASAASRGRRSRSTT